MQVTPSRREKREAKFYFLAEQGKMECNDVSLFKSEESSLRNRKNGFYVVRHGADEKKSLPSTVSWKEAFNKSGMPLIVFEYIKGKINIFPKSGIVTWAQELYVIAARANYEKAQEKP